MMNWVVTPRPLPAWRTATSNCSLLDVPCHIGRFIAPWLFWIEVAAAIFALLVLLWVFSRLKDIGGWPAVVAGLVGLAGTVGFIYGRRSVKVATRGGKARLTAEQIMALQRALAARQLYPGGIDGKFGAKSQAGMKAFQRMRGEAQTGMPTYEQLRDLGIHLPRGGQ